MITAEDVNRGLLIFYTIGAVLLVIGLIVVYPNLRDEKRSKKPTK